MRHLLIHLSLLFMVVLASGGTRAQADEPSKASQVISLLTQLRDRSDSSSRGRTNREAGCRRHTRAARPAIAVRDVIARDVIADGERDGFTSGQVDLVVIGGVAGNLGGKNCRCRKN